MGILDTIFRALRRGASRSVNSKISNTVANETTKRVDKALKNDSSRPFDYDVADAQYKLSKKVHVIAAQNMPLFFDEIMKSRFSEYQVKKNVAVKSIFANAEDGLRPYSYAIYSSSKLLACIMLTDHNRGNNRAFKLARQTCLDAKVPFLNFYTHMIYTSDENYVVSRIGAAIK